ncbi:tetratricopeptide repeat protein [Marispirochaeta sp.]|uniref:tetratricopeptide repeat protein n=1 Tax=Marispirochaeta sp. TaxID=2038653 RepID=UPI0029C81360|nr:tetratricopeptide repeat protein [Marispirochaeta sp.]
MKHGIAVLIILTITVFFSSCVGVPAPEDIPADLSPMEYFQRAQEAVAQRNDYDTAMVYYQTFKERFPEDLQENVEADYEIAFLHYKKGEYTAAKAMFNEIIARYETEQASRLKEWPLILSRKVLAKIETLEVLTEAE